MECIEARALKSSFLSELAMKSSQQVFFDDLLSVNGVNGVSGDEFSVDVFLDLSNENSEDGFVEEESEGERDDTPSVSENRVEDDNSYNNSTTFSGSGDSGSLPAGELALPVDELEHLEWLSQFVDDSVSGLSLLCPAGDLKEITGYSSVNRTELVSRPVVQKISPLCFTSPVPAKARSKRSRPSGGRTWSRGSSSSLSGSTSTPSSSPGSSPISVFTFSNLVQRTDMAYGVAKPPAKKHKKRPPPAAGTGDEASQMQRRCRHCHVQKTPQWRTGPLGPKTLCNACGVRYKSGRLLPEYRPACSPTFSVAVHSNSHRKVIEMRQKKELSGAKIGLLTGMVPSF